MPTSTVDGDLVVRGNVSGNGFNLPGNSVGDTEHDSNRPLETNKTLHQYTPRLSQAHGTAAVAERRVVHVARGVGSLLEVRLGLVVACVGGATVTVDVLRNGTTVLSSAKVLDNTNAAFAVTTAGLASSPTNYSDGDVFEVSVTVAVGGGTLGQGLFVQLVCKEKHD